MLVSLTSTTLPMSLVHAINYKTLTTSPTRIMESETDGSSSKIGTSVGADKGLGKIGGDGRPYSGTIARCLCEGCQGQKSESLSNHVVTDVESEME